MQRRSVTDSRAEVQLVQTGRYGKKEAEALVGSVTRYPPTRHSDRRIVMDAYQVMDYKEEKEEEEEDGVFLNESYLKLQSLRHHIEYAILA